MMALAFRLEFVLLVSLFFCLTFAFVEDSDSEDGKYSIL